MAPTPNKADLLNTLDAVTTGRGTTIGAAILKSLDAIAELDPNVAPSTPEDAPNPDGSSIPRSPESGDGSGLTPTPNASGDAPEIVLLLTDGANTRGITPEDAAVQAAARGVRVYPIGFGTKNPTQMVCSASQLGGMTQQRFGGGRDFGGGGTPGGPQLPRRRRGRAKTVASTTGGEYFAATDADQLQSVLANLPKHVTTQQQDVDISAGFIAAATLLLLLDLGLSIRWRHPVRLSAQNPERGGL